MNENVTMTTALLSKFRKCVPQLTEQLRKGQCGRIAVIGGSEEYTGAPYFAAISSLKTGADLVHVFCQSSAAAVIKSYSPELIVHPLVKPDCQSPSALFEHLRKMHVIVVGPGFGRELWMSEWFSQFFQFIRTENIPCVVDADALFYVAENPSLVSGLTNVILTPNIVEFNRILSKFSDETNADSAKLLAEKMGYLTIVLKGKDDLITDGEQVFHCSVPGSNRRCGGQGDLLSGALGTFLRWTSHNTNTTDTDNCASSAKDNACVSAAYAACMLTRLCAKEAYALNARSVTTTDLIAQIQHQLHKVIGE